MQQLERQDTQSTIDIDGVQDNDLEQLSKYLSATCFTLLNINKDVFHKELHENETKKILKQFAIDKNQRSLLIAKVDKSNIKPIDGINTNQNQIQSNDGQQLQGTKEKLQEDDNFESDSISQIEDGNDQGKVELRFSLKIVYLGQLAHTIAFMKREQFAVLDFKANETGRSMATQLQVINLGFMGEDSNIFELAATYVEYSLLPLFSSYKLGGQAQSDEKGASKGNATSGLENVQKNLLQLKVHLVQCQQNLDIPEIELIIDSDIRAKVEEFRLLGKLPSEEDFDTKLNEEFHKRLEKCVTQWYRDIRKVTSLNHDPTSGSALQEINFWLSLERSLILIKEQLKKHEVKLTLSLLKQKGGTRIVFTFENDTDLEKTLNTAQNYNKLLRDFPINALLSANDLDQIANAIESIFKQLKTIKTYDNSYPIQRAMQLLEALFKDITNQLTKVIQNYQIMSIDYKDFKVIQKSIHRVFDEIWIKNLRTFKDIIRSQITKRQQKEGIQTIQNLETSPFKERLNAIIAFRYQHYKLKQVISKTLSNSGSGIGRGSADSRNFEEQALTDINDSYNLFLNINVLDISKEGNDIWEATKKNYDLKIDKVEGQITASLRDKLSSAVNSNEMFKVFSVFNALFTRPRIRGAIQEYQNQLLTQVKKDISLLKEKLINDSGNDQIQMMNATKDVPTISNNILWVRQIERKLQEQLQKVQKVLGEKWEDQIEGKDLKTLGDMFQQKLTNRQTLYFENWTNEIQPIDVSKEKENTIFTIETKMDKYEMVLNFNQKLFSLFKEQTNLKRLGFKISLSVNLKAQEVQSLYPLAMSLKESLRTFQYTNSKVNNKFSKLIAQVKQEAQNYLLEGLQLTWKAEQRVDTYTKKLSNKVMIFEESVNEVMEKTSLIEETLNELGQCEIQKELMQAKLKAIQQIVDEFNFQEYSNMSSWVEELDQRIEKILTARLEELVNIWVKEFSTFQDGGNKILIKIAQNINVLEIKIQNQTIIVDPPLAEARAFWYKEFHSQLETVCGLQRVEAARYEKFKDKDQNVKKVYQNLIIKMNQKDLNNAYTVLETQLKNAEAYVKRWKSYQALWDIDAAQVFQLLGEDIDKWHQLLNEIRSGRKIFDNSEIESHFGAIVIFYGNIQSKVNNKYDQWHKDILNKFGNTLADNMKNYNATILKARRQLETLSIDDQTDVTLFVTEIQEMKRQVNPWQAEINSYKSGQKLLTNQRYQFSLDWLQIDQIEGEWSAFKQALTKKNKIMEDQIPTLQAKIIDEEKVVNEKIKEIEEEWKTKRPFSGQIAPKSALDSLSIIGTKVNQAKGEWIRICKAKELLEMELGNPKRLNDLEEDLGGLKSLWQELNKVWSIVDQINEIPFSAYVHKKVKEQLDVAQEQLIEFNNRLRQYQVYDDYKAQLTKYRKVNLVFSDLKSEAMKPRHWKDLLIQLKIKTHFNDLTLNHLWIADLMKNDKIVKDIMNQARGELILEDFLRNIKETWSKYELELIKYQTKCKLIKGWDELFQQIDEHINNLQSMKMSPYYKVFEEEILPWDDKLQKIRIIFDNWIDVQRRYVYLEGIFFGSADIKTMLASEFNRFKGIDNEFTTLMKKVASKPIVLEVLNIQNLQKTLERFSDMLSKIQKALGDYLETQRQNFARFYFVGDEDLLEIIGNSKEIKMVQRHFPKMFAGITTMNHENEGDSLIGMFSKEGEYVTFNKNVIISEDSIIYVWLSKIEQTIIVSG